VSNAAAIAPPHLVDWLSLTNRQPTYRILENYNHLVQLPEGSERVVLKGWQPDAVANEILRVVGLHFKQLERLAFHLRGNTFEESCYNIWHWIQSNIKYKLDDQGTEQIRVPARGFYDAQTSGIDCEDYSIITSSLLTNLGIPHRFAIVKFSGQQNYGHIYVAVGIQNPGIYKYPGPPGGLIIDRLTAYDKNPIGISETMDVTVLSGITTLGANAGASDAVTNQLTAIKSKLLGKSYRTPAEQAELRKVNALLAMRNEPEFKFVLPVSKWIIDVDRNGEWLWRMDTPEQLIKDYFDDVLTSGDLYEEQQKSGLGITLNLFPLSGLAGQAEREERRRRRKEKAAAASPDGKPPKGAKKIAHTIAKFSPLTIAARNAFLLVLEINPFHLATKLGIGYLTEEQAKELNLNMTEFRKLKNVSIPKLERLYYTAFGGDVKRLRQVITKVYKRKPGLKGLGAVDPATGTVLAVATPLIVGAGTALATVDFKQLSKDSKDKALAKAAVEGTEETDSKGLKKAKKLKDSLKSMVDKAKAAFGKEGGPSKADIDALSKEIGGDTDGSSQPGGAADNNYTEGGDNNNTSGTGGNTALYIGIGVGVLALVGVVVAVAGKNKGK